MVLFSLHAKLSFAELFIRTRFYLQAILQHRVSHNLVAHSMTSTLSSQPYSWWTGFLICSDLIVPSGLLSN